MINFLRFWCIVLTINSDKGCLKLPKTVHNVGIIFTFFFHCLFSKKNSCSLPNLTELELFCTEELATHFISKCAQLVETHLKRLAPVTQRRVLWQTTESATLCTSLFVKKKKEENHVGFFFLLSVAVSQTVLIRCRQICDLKGTNTFARHGTSIRFGFKLCRG